ncbi:linker histone H1M [Odontesthes bonariensis]
MVKEALQALDSRKGVSSQAIRSYIKEKYPSVDLVRLTHLVRNCLKKGIESGTLVRPANASVATGATGKFRLAPKAKELKSKAENVDPNEQTAPKAAKDGDEKPKKAGTTKKKPPANGEPKPSEDKPPKKEGSSKPTKTKAVKTVKGAKTGKAAQSKAAKAENEAPATKATRKRGKKTEEM